MGPPHSDVDLQLLENKVLSRGIIRKSAPILTEITIRKSHPLEGSCQEAILLPHTTFDVFSIAFRSAHSTSADARRRIRVLAATPKSEVKRHGALGYSSDCMPVVPGSYSASNFAGAAWRNATPVDMPIFSYNGGRMFITP